MKILEIIAVLFSLTCLIGIMCQKTWSWFFSILSVSIYFIVYLNEELYAQVGLQVIFFIQSIIGWHRWSNNDSHLPITSIKLTKKIIATTLVSLYLGYFLSINDYGNQPYLNAAVACFSLMANDLLTRKVLQTWLFWMIVNVLGVIMFYNQHMYASIVLFVLFFIISIKSYISWNREYLLTSRKP